MPVERTRYGTWRARWTDPWGRQVAKTWKTKTLAQAHYKRVLGDMARGEYVDPRLGRITLARWADEWLAGARNLSRGTVDTYRRDLDRYILPVLGKVPVGRLSGADIDRYLTAIIDGTYVRRGTSGLRPEPAHGREGAGHDETPNRCEAAADVPPAGLAPSTVHRHYRTLHRMLEVARKRGLIARNPCEHIEPPRVPKTERTAFTIAQVDDLAAAIADRYRAWVYVMAYGGLRWSEAIGLRRMDVEGRDQPPPRDGASSRQPRPSPDESTRLLVRSQLVHRGPGEWERTATKTGKSRTVTLPGFAADELAAHLERYSLPGPDGLVFPTRNGTPVQSPSFTANTFRRALERAGLPRIRIHDLRHTAVSLAIDAGANIKVSQERAGHASASLHLDVYGHRYEAADVAVAERLDVLRAESLRARLRAV